METTITSVTAMLIERAVSVFLETPKNGQIPRNFESTILLVSIAAKRIDAMEVALFIYFRLPFSVFAAHAFRGAAFAP